MHIKLVKKNIPKRLISKLKVPTEMTKIPSDLAYHDPSNLISS